MERRHLIAVDSVSIPRIYSIGFSDDTEITRFGPSVRNQYIIHYVLSGKGSFNGNTVRRGEGFLIFPGTREEYYPDEDEPWSFLWIISDDPAMQYFFDLHNAGAKTGVFKFHNLYETEAVAERVLSSQSSFYSSTRLSEIFLHIFHSCVATESTQRSSVTDLYFEFSVNYIKANLHLPLSVEDLCCAIGITQPYLYRVFKERVHCSPKQYIMRSKLDEAKRLLVQTELSVSQIAVAVGFQSCLDFSRFFSGRIHRSPTEYRRAYTTI